MIEEKKFYGRRQGKPLTKLKTDLVENHLPKYIVTEDSIKNDKIDKLYLEIGFGGGEHIAKLAEQNPTISFIGAEPFINGVASLLTKITEQNIKNIKIYNDDVRKILPYFKEKSVDSIYILFPDPWHKKRHNKRRIINTETLEIFYKIMKDDAKLTFATDHEDYSAYFLSHIMSSKYFKINIENPNDIFKKPKNWVNTRYEQKAIKQGKKCMYFTLEKKKN